MVKNETYPFISTLNTTTAKIQVSDFANTDGYYRICKNKFEELYKNIQAPSDTIKVTRSINDNGDTGIAVVERNGWIEPVVCTNSSSNFSIQLRCEDAKKVFPDRIKECRGTTPVYRNGEIRGLPVTLNAVPPA